MLIFSSQKNLSDLPEKRRKREKLKNITLLSDYKDICYQNLSVCINNNT